MTEKTHAKLPQNFTIKKRGTSSREDNDPLGISTDRDVMLNEPANYAASLLRLVEQILSQKNDPMIESIRRFRSKDALHTAPDKVVFVEINDLVTRVALPNQSPLMSWTEGQPLPADFFVGAGTSNTILAKKKESVSAVAAAVARTNDAIKQTQDTISAMTEQAEFEKKRAKEERAAARRAVVGMWADVTEDSVKIQKRLRSDWS